MSTIPTTSKQHQIPYTVVGGKKQDKISRYPEKFTLLILNRQGRVYKQEMFSDFERLGFGEIVSLESPGTSYDTEHLARRFPRVRFLQFGENNQETAKPTIGEKINIGFEEAKGRFVCVIWSDLRFRNGVIPPSVFDEIQSQPVLCRVPLLHDPKGEIIPSLQGPAFYKNTLKIVPMETDTGANPTIYPFDYVGFYDKEKFLLSGGFDSTIKSHYWQILDFGFRNYMWGERITALSAFRMDYLHDPSGFDTSIDEGYKKFFLKNLAVRYHRDCGILSKWKFFQFYFKSGLPLLQALREFKEVQGWVTTNTYRFKQDAVSVTDLWRVE